MLLAAVQATHYVVDEPTILADTLAESLAGEFAAGFIARAGRTQWPSPRGTWQRHIALGRGHPGRSPNRRRRPVRAFGGGLDSFAYRRPHRAEGLQVFEVDRPTSQAWERRRLAEVGVDIPMSVRFVPVDFERHDLDEELSKAGFDDERPASWPGGRCWLAHERGHRWRSTASLMGARVPPGARLRLPKHLWDSFEGWDGDVMRGIAAVVGAIGEPWRSLFTPQEVEVLLRAHGYDAVEHLDDDAVRSTYMGGHPPGLPGPHPWQRIGRATVARRPGEHRSDSTSRRPCQDLLQTWPAHSDYRGARSHASGATNPAPACERRSVHPLCRNPSNLVRASPPCSRVSNRPWLTDRVRHRDGSLREVEPHLSSPTA